MKAQKNYGWLDRFRPIAALLVVAIHTSPLASFSPDADFFFTRVLARIAVPFFFMVTGHFILGAPAACTSPRLLLRRFLKKLCILYGASALLYLPLGLYAGHYRKLSLADALRMLVFDGPFYHLWYFPACILGVLLVALLKRFFSLRGVTVISALLYIAGLLGDSYFGLAEKVPVLNSAYRLMFHLFSYTRNGLFLAPLFLVLGIWASASPRLHSSRLYAGCLALSFGAMTAEAFVLRYFHLQRHDSMYIFLVPVMFFLYLLLLSPAAPQKGLRTAAMWIYVLHPAFIVAVRGFAKLLHLTALLVDNSIIHYLTVALFSLGAGLFLARLQSRLSCRTGTNLKSRRTQRAWIELDMAALEHNVRFLKSQLPKGCRLMPAVKANAYGHGAIPVASELNRLGIDAFCVACTAEGVELRRAGIKGEILILGYTSPDLFPLLRRYRLTQTVLDYAYAESMENSGIRLHVHIAVDTGMHRLGIRCEDIDRIADVYEMKNLVVDGIYTHLSACDSDRPQNRSFTECQIASFLQVTDMLKTKGCPCRGLHLLSSYGILNYPEAAADYVRPGIALYGLLSTEEDSRRLSDAQDSGADTSPLLPVLSLKARVSSLRVLHSGESAGYGLSFVADQEKKIAVLSIGYADGLPRALSDGNGRVLINGYSAPVVGRVCMDQTLVDVSQVPKIAPGDIAVLIGASGAQKITAGELAGRCNTIANEILSRLGARPERIVL